MMLANRTDRFNVAKDALELVTQNFTSTNNIKGDERRYRVGKVIASVHEKTAHYASQCTRMLKYAEETQMGKFSNRLLFMLTRADLDSLSPRQITPTSDKSLSSLSSRSSRPSLDPPQNRST